MEEIIEIEIGSQAWKALAEAFKNPIDRTYKVRLNVRQDGIAVKVNEGMWSATLTTRSPNQ